MYVRSYCFAVQMRVSLSFFKNRFYIFKVNLCIHGAGRRLDEKIKQSLAVVSLRNVAPGMEKPLLIGIPKSERSRQKINILQENIDKFYSFPSTNFITGQRMWIKTQRFPKNCIKKGIKYFIALKRKMSTHTFAPLLPFSSFFSFFKYHPCRTFTSDSSWCV